MRRMTLEISGAGTLYAPNPTNAPTDARPTLKS
ncbi:hypothetical protein SAMN00790413_05223 [Deinococcus hopiensis KR-140]|uniref:Uncharacterized protein n=1 Tax=Deinococcus hopiensis KR-140 TaxID=695939 RepID=A0A1W1UU76_9DEIO|nr:hypothetical protein SAMN00790413_05223 [Deinococcus hopiensis KR-140]